MIARQRRRAPIRVVPPSRRTFSLPGLLGVAVTCGAIWLLATSDGKVAVGVVCGLVIGQWLGQAGIFSEDDGRDGK